MGWRHAHTLYSDASVLVMPYSQLMYDAQVFFVCCFMGPEFSWYITTTAASWSGLFCKVTKQPIVFVVCHHKSSGDSLRFGGEIFRVMFFPVFGSVPSTPNAI